MTARIPQEVREQQIAELCEGTIYSFVGWVGKYIGKKSRFSMKCEKHGIWVTNSASFVHSRGRCAQCGIEKNAAKYVVPTHVRERQILDKCETTGDIFLGWESSHKNNESNIHLKCQNHGDFIIKFSKYVLGGQGCSICGRERQKKAATIDKEKRLFQINKRCLEIGYTFEGWVTEYESCESKMTISCSQHGRWVVDVSHFLNHETGCPTCGVGGFKGNSPGYLYLLASDCGGYLKVGVSNNIQRRLRELKYNTPFGFNAVRIKCFAIGQNAIQWEKIFHSTFKNANMVDFDGATEWLKWDNEIPLWFDFI